MKKNKILILIFVIFFLIFLYHIITHKRGYTISREKEIEEYYQFLCPIKDTYSICVLRDNEIIPVANQDFLNCGDKVSVIFRFDFIDKNYILCFSRDKLIGGSSEVPETYYYDNGSKVFACEPSPLKGIFYEWGTIPQREGIFKFVEIYSFPKNLNMKEKELLENLSLGKKILTIEKEIKCP
jgi:preprotein translocase subunit YajC